MKKLISKILTLSLFISTIGFADTEKTGVIHNRKTDETVRFVKEGDIIKVVLTKRVGVYSQEELLNEFTMTDLFDGAVTIRSKKGLELKVFKSLKRTSKNIGDTMGETIVDMTDACTAGLFDGWDTAWPAVCIFPIPGIVVAVPAVATGMSVATVAVFISAFAVLPVEAAIKSLGKLFGPEHSAEKALQKALDGKETTISDKAFDHLVDGISGV